MINILENKRIRRNSIIFMVRNIMNVLFPLITFKYASNVILAEGIGAVNYSSAIIGYFSLIAQLGIYTYACAEGTILRKNKSRFNIFFNQILTINLISTLISYACLFVFLSLSKNLNNYKIMILIYSVSILCNTLGVEWLFVIYEDFIYITLRSIIFQFISLIFLFLFVKSKNDTVIYLIINLFATSGSYLLNFAYAKKYVHLRLVSLKSCFIHLKPILFIWISNVASLIYINADTIIIGTILGDSAVGIYSASTKIVRAICVPISTICTVSGPQISLAIGTSDYEKLNGLCQNVLNTLLFFALPGIVLLSLLAKTAILLISGPTFLEGIISLKILILDILLSPLNGFFVNQLLVPAHKEKKTMISLIIAAFFNIILDIILIPKYGINGAAIATVVSELIVLFVCFSDIKKIIDLKIVFKDSWKFIFASLLICLISYLLKFFDFTWSIYSFLLIVFSSIFYLGTIFFTFKK